MDIRDAVKSGLTGVVLGAVIVTTIGFSALGWKTPGEVERLAADRAEAAVVKVLTPICVKQFRQQDNFAARLAELKDAPSWARYQVIEKAGWATIPGTDETHTAVARACAAQVGEMS